MTQTHRTSFSSPVPLAPPESGDNDFIIIRTTGIGGMVVPRLMLEKDLSLSLPRGNAHS